MKKLISLLFFVFGLTYGYSQYVYYGYPTDKLPLRKGDIVVLNIPSFALNGGNRFVKMEQIDSLVKFIEINYTNILRIEINNFLGLDSLFCEGISERLCSNLKEILESKTTLKNYYIVNNGVRNPISCKKEEKNRRLYIRYVGINSRMEIIVE
jgi:hypothetical protein